MNIQTIASVLFLIFLTLFLIKNRGKIKIQKLIWPILYLALYKTKLGLKSMDAISRRYPKTVDVVSRIGAFIGTIGIIVIAALLIKNLYDIFFVKSAVQGVALVLPFKVKGGFFVPFFYWIISIFVIAVVHEFSHGIVSRLHNIPIKSSGFAFFSVVIPVIPAAFVEPDEKILAEKRTMQKLSVYAAGPFANIVTGILFLLLFIALSYPVSSGIMQFNGVSVQDYTNGSNAELAGVQQNSIITEIGGIKVVTVENLSSALAEKEVGESVMVKTNEGVYNVTLGPNPENESLPYLGVLVSQSFETKPEFKEKYGEGSASLIMWFMGLLFWLYILSIGIGLFNLIPVGPIDGGQMSREYMFKIFKDKAKAIKAWALISFIFLAIILLNLFSGFF